MRPGLGQPNGQKWLVADNQHLFAREGYLERGFEDARDYLELSVNHQDTVGSHCLQTDVKHRQKA